MKIAFLMLHGKVHNSAGGAPKVFFDLSERLSKYHEVYCIYSDNRPGTPFFNAGESVSVQNLRVKNTRGLKRIIHKLCRELIRGAKKAGIGFFSKKFGDPLRTYNQKLLSSEIGRTLEEIRPDLVIFFGLSDLMSVRYSNWSFEKNKSILMCHSDAARVLSESSFYELSSISKVSCVQVLLDSYCSSFDAFARRVVVIGNYVEPSINEINYSRDNIIVSLGRVEPNKNQLLLLKAFNQLPEGIKEGWKIEIYGECASTQYAEQVKGYIDKFLNGRASYCGVTKDVPDVLAKASIFAFPSKTEGFPLALIEAMSYGLPSIALKECTGVNVIINDGVDGFLVESEKEFSNKLLDLMSNKLLRSEIGDAAEGAVVGFTANAVTQQWLDLIDSLD